MHCRGDPLWSPLHEICKPLYDQYIINHPPYYNTSKGISQHYKKGCLSNYQILIENILQSEIDVNAYECFKPIQRGKKGVWDGAWECCNVVGIVEEPAHSNHSLF